MSAHPVIQLELLSALVLVLLSKGYVFGKKLPCTPECTIELQENGTESVISCTCTCENAQNVLCRVRYQDELSTADEPQGDKMWYIIGGVSSVVAVVLVLFVLVCLLMIVKKRHRPVRRCSKTRWDATTATATTSVVATPANSGGFQDIPPECERQEALPRVMAMRRTRSCSAITNRPRDHLTSSHNRSVSRPRLPSGIYNAAFSRAPDASTAPSDNETLSVANLTSGVPYRASTHQTQPKALYPHLHTYTNGDVSGRLPVSSFPAGTYVAASRPHETQAKTPVSSSSGLEDSDYRDTYTNGFRANSDHSLWVSNTSDYDSCPSLETQPKQVYSPHTAIDTAV